MTRFTRLVAVVLASVVISSGLAAASATSVHRTVGRVLTLSNDPSHNAVLVFARAGDGTLSPRGSIPTGGRGSGDSLGSQGALAMSEDGRWLLAVNAGSHQVSLLSVTRHGIQTRDVAWSGGHRPISVTVHGRLVYVLNDETDNLFGFRLRPWSGELKPIWGSSAPLSGTDIDPAQVEFAPNGRHLVVTEKNTNLIDVYRVRHRGRLGAPEVQASEGATPFGFGFDPAGRLIVSEAFGGAPGASAVSSYRVGLHGVLETISPSVPDGQAAACWIVVTRDGRFAYTTNTGSDNISGYAIGPNGTLTLLQHTFPTGDGPIDAAQARNSYVYALNAGSSDISAFSIGHDGSLSAIAGVSGLPATAVGLVAR